MKYRIRFTIEYEDTIEYEGEYEDAERIGENRRRQLEDAMNILGIIDSDEVTTLYYVEEMNSPNVSSKHVIPEAE